MIDQSLIDQNISKLTNSAQNSKTVDNCLRLITDAFDQSLLSKLTDYFDKNYNSKLWAPETDSYGV